MSPLGAIGKILLDAAGSLLVGATKRLVDAAKESIRPKAPPIVVPKPISEDRYVEGVLTQTERDRGKRIGEKMTEDARKRLADWSDD